MLAAVTWARVPAAPRLRAESGGAALSTLADPCRGALLSGSSYVPDGMCARVVATGVTDVRQISFSSDGALWATSGTGAIAA
ncbi:MAG: hypothetical protein WDO74_07450 [Pseudomonadota bacterium]